MFGKKLETIWSDSSNRWYVVNDDKSAAEAMVIAQLKAKFPDDYQTSVTLIPASADIQKKYDQQVWCEKPF